MQHHAIKVLYIYARPFHATFAVLFYYIIRKDIYKFLDFYCAPIIHFHFYTFFLHDAEGLMGNSKKILTVLQRAYSTVFSLVPHKNSVYAYISDSYIIKDRKIKIALSEIRDVDILIGEVFRERCFFSPCLYYIPPLAISLRLNCKHDFMRMGFILCARVLVFFAAPAALVPIIQWPLFFFFCSCKCNFTCTTRG